MLVLLGTKVMASELLGIEKVPAMVFLDITASFLIGGIALSLWQTRETCLPVPSIRNLVIPE